MSYIKQLLKQREQDNKPINIAIVGAGWFGEGLIYELGKWPGMQLRLIFTRRPDDVTEMLIQAGIDQAGIVTIDNQQALQQSINKGYTVICTNLSLVKQLSGIDVLFDASGDVLLGADVAVSVINQGIHFVTTSAELDATIGYTLNKMAEDKGVVFSNANGDQPGLLARMIVEVEQMGFSIAVAGNGKGFLNYHAVPEDIMQFVRPGDSARKITSFTDGTKQSLELATLANGCGLSVDIRGMHGVKTSKENMVGDITDRLSQDGVVEYFMGSDKNYGMTVFVIGKRENDPQKTFDDLKYLKMGDGPYYLFFRDYHLCYFETPLSIAEAVLFNTATIKASHLKADVITVAKRDLKAGEAIDGIGGYMVYGLIDSYSVAIAGNYLPLGLAEFATLNCDVPKDTPVTYAMVSFKQDNQVLELRRQQDAEFAEQLKAERACMY